MRWAKTPPLLCSRWRYSHKPLWSSYRCQRQARQELLDSWEDLPHPVKPQICGHPQSEWNHSPLPVEGFCYSGRRGSAEAEVCLKDSFQQDTLPKGKTIIWSQGVLVLVNGLGQVNYPRHQGMCPWASGSLLSTSHSSSIHFHPLQLRMMFWGGKVECNDWISSESKFAFVGATNHWGPEILGLQKVHEAEEGVSTH